MIYQTIEDAIQHCAGKGKEYVIERRLKDDKFCAWPTNHPECPPATWSNTTRIPAIKFGDEKAFAQWASLKIIPGFEVAEDEIIFKSNRPKRRQVKCSDVTRHYRIWAMVKKIGRPCDLAEIAYCLNVDSRASFYNAVLELERRGHLERTQSRPVKLMIAREVPPAKYVGTTYVMAGQSQRKRPRERILKMLRTGGGMTTGDIAAKLSFCDRRSINKALCELRKQNVVFVSGYLNRQYIWELTEKGKERADQLLRDEK